MRHRKHTFKINRTASHRRAMLANMACALIAEGQIRTTLVRAKELRRVVERMITLGKRGSLHARRQAIAFLRDPAVTRTLFAEIAPRFGDRAGGYTRIIKLGKRIGDAAEMCIIEILNEPVTPKDKAPQAQKETGAAAQGTPAQAAIEEAASEEAAPGEEAVAEEAAADETEAKDEEPPAEEEKAKAE